MSPVLSQEEIDALLTAASDQNSSGGHASAFEGDPRTSVIGYNFRRPLFPGQFFGNNHRLDLEL